MNKKSELNIFKGKQAIRDFLDPSKGAYYPLVEIPDSLNPFNGDKVRIFAKLMTFSSLHNVKIIPAFNMLKEKFNRGELDGVSKIIENSSGNTISALAIAARQYGIDDIFAFVPAEISKHKLIMLQFFGISPIVNTEPKDPSPGDLRSGISKAKKKGEESDWLNPGQYENEDNPLSHEKWIGKQIWEQTEGKIDVFCASLGTTGTVIGNSKFLKKMSKRVQVVGVKRAPNNYVPGPRTDLLLKLVGFDWQKHVDNLQEAETAESYQKSLELSRQGILVGPSAGLALVGLLKYLSERSQNNSLDELRGENREIITTFICPDTPFPYIEEYFNYLPANQFPNIENQDLLSTD